MADITSLLPATTPTSGDIVYGVTDPGGTPADAVFDVADLTGQNVYPDFTTPVDGDYAWINQGGASVTVNGNGGIFLLAPADASNNIRIRKKAVPGATYTITTAFLVAMPAEGGTPFVGIGWRASGSGKLIVVTMQEQNGNNLAKLQVIKYDSPTSFSANVSAVYWNFPPVVWFRIKDDGTDRKGYISADGYNFIEVYSETNTTYITADEVLFCVNALNGTYPIGMTLLSWEET